MVAGSLLDFGTAAIEVVGLLASLFVIFFYLRPDGQH